jgi:hydrogenase/urease accessory protein HupE
LFALDGNGNNFFTLTGVTGGFLSFTTFSSPGVEADIVADVKQIRLGVVGVIPEPETYALMLAGLGAVGFFARRRKAVR